MFLPTTCPGCGTPGPAPCAGCVAGLVSPAAAPPPEGLDAWWALVSYEGVGRELVARLKYRGNRCALRWLADQMAALVDPVGVDVVTWVPTTAERRRARGFDQAELLARAVARRLRRPCRRLLHRSPGPPQTGRSRDQRLHGPRLSTVGPVSASVLLVDDVATTGASLSMAARVLSGAGAPRVWALTGARTPSRSRALPSIRHTTNQEL